jgi:hypothetical protein
LPTAATTAVAVNGRVLNYSAIILSHLHNVLAFSIIGFLLMMMAGSSYPFPRSDIILRFSWMMLLVAVVFDLPGSAT